MDFLSSVNEDEYKRILDSAREKWMREKDLPPISVPSLPPALLLAQALKTDAFMNVSSTPKSFSCEPELGLKTSRANGDHLLLSILLLFPSSWHTGDAGPQSAPSMPAYLYSPFQTHPSL